MNTGNNPDGIRKMEGIDKDNWQRANHILNMLTTAQLMCLEGERRQEPYIISVGVNMMLDVIGPVLKESVMETVVVLDNQGKEITKEVKKTYKGKDTTKYKDYYAKIVHARYLISLLINYKLNNRHEILTVAYQDLIETKTNLLQDSSDLGFDFKAKDDPYQAYKK